ncbi:MAG: S-methyl-5-thioribose-1-phosphate isomerase [Gemmataceae bacterium]
MSLQPGRPWEATAPVVLEWQGGVQGHVRLLDQTRLPEQEVYLECRTVEEVHAAIRRLCVRGAPAIGLAAAYGFVLGIRQRFATGPFLHVVAEVSQLLRTARPTAVNLFWALERMEAAAREVEADDLESILRRLLQVAQDLQQAEAERCYRIAEHGVHLLTDGIGVLTHCNTGALATGAWGTALAPLFLAWERGKRFRVYVDETRPLLQGARLTAWELAKRGIPTTVMCDSAASVLMRAGQVQLVLVGADRIAANGDVANKIGTYGLALAARAHGIPLYVAAPTSSFDLGMADGTCIPIEVRAAEEVAYCGNRRTVPEGVAVYNPAFDVTPAPLISGIITERGIITPVNAASVAQALGELSSRT